MKSVSNEPIAAITDVQLNAAVLDNFVQQASRNPGHISCGVLVKSTAGSLGLTATNWDSATASGDARRIMSAIWGLVRHGLVYPVLAMKGNNNTFVRLSALIPTPHGARFIENPLGNPYTRDFTRRITEACPGLPQEIVARFEDAYDCHYRGLHRAAVVMLRLAYEQMIRAIYSEHVECRVVNPPKRPTLKECLDLLVDVARMQKDCPEGLMHMTAYIAEIVRQEGNDAAHSWVRDFADTDGVSQLLVLASVNVPAFWKLRDIF